METEPDRESTGAADGLRRLPVVLLVLAGACAVSALIGLAAALLGRPAPPLGLMLAPPVLALAGAGWWLARAARSGR